MTTNNTLYISRKDTAALVRKDLKTAFPEIKFSVRMNSGNSINVEWSDGVTASQVEAVVGKYEGATFDGMQDLKSHIYSTNETGQSVHYGTDYIFYRREYSREHTQKIAEMAAHYYGLPVPVMNKDGWYDYDANSLPVESHSYDSLPSKIREWQQHAVINDDGSVTFVTTKQQFIFLNENPGITLSPTCYSEQRKAAIAAQQAAAQIEAAAPVVDPVIEEQSMSTEYDVDSLSDAELAALKELFHVGAVKKGGLPEFIAPFEMLVARGFVYIDPSGFYESSKVGRDYLRTVEAANDEQPVKYPRRSEQEIADLKSGWLKDPCWDIESTEGYEAHREELAAYHQEQRQLWKEARDLNLKTRALELGCTPELAAYIQRLEQRIAVLEQSTIEIESNR